VCLSVKTVDITSQCTEWKIQETAKPYFRCYVVKIQITVLEDESITAGHIEDVFGFTAKNIYFGRDNLSAALYRISVSMRITPDVTVMLAV